MAVKPIPEGYHTVTPYLTVQEAAKLIDFLKKAFGATETHPPHKRPDGTIMHAEVKIGDSRIMISDANEQVPATKASLYLYVEDADAVYKRALSAGSTSVMEVTDMFYGDRSGGVKDAFGNRWWIGTHKEDVSAPELEKRFKNFIEQQKNKAA
jgi:PhnB protein